MKVKQWRFTTVSAVEFGAAIFLALVALVIGIGAYLDTRLYFSFRAGMRHFGSREWGKAQENFQDAVKFRPGYRYSHEFLAMIITYLGELDEAERIYNEYNMKFKNPLCGRVGLAVIAMKRYDAGGRKDKNQLDEAIHQFEEARKIDLKCAEVSIDLAHIALLQGKYEYALRLLDEVERDKLVPTLDGLVDYHTARGIIAHSKGTSESGATAAKEFRKAWHVAPERIVPLANFGYMEGKRYGDPSLPITELDDFKVQRLLNMIRDMQYTYERDLERHIALKGAVYSMRIGLGRAYYNLRRNVRDAEDKFVHAYMGDPKRPDALLWKARVNLLESKMPDVRDDRSIVHKQEALRNYRDVAERQVIRQWSPDISPQLMSACLNNDAVLEVSITSDVYSGAVPIALQGAVKKLKDALKLEPNDAILHRNLGAVYDRLKDKENAIHHYRKSLAAKEGQKELEDRIETLESKQE